MIWNIITNTAKAVGFTTIAVSYVAVEGTKRIYRGSKEAVSFCKDTFAEMKLVLKANGIVKGSKVHDAHMAIAMQCDTAEEYEAMLHEAGMLDYCPVTNLDSVRNMTEEEKRELDTLDD